MANSLIKKPVISEKSISAQSSHQKYTFLVDRKATATQVVAHIKNLFNVEVIGVNMINLPGKVKRYRRIKGVRSDRRHAIVTLKKGQSIPLFEEEAK